MDQIVTFNDKSLYNRLDDFVQAFNGIEKLPGHKIQEVWSDYLETTIDPAGWQAVWKIKRKTCETLKLIYPTIVMIQVEYIDFKELSAVVKVLAVEDHIISLPSKNLKGLQIGNKYRAPLIELLPTQDQDSTVALLLENTANALDAFRYFFLNMWMPWDVDDESYNWANTYLENRLRLSQDIQKGTIPVDVCTEIKAVMIRARHLQEERERLEKEINTSDDDNVDENDGNVKKLTDLIIEIMEMRTQIDIFEKPELRLHYIKTKINNKVVSSDAPTNQRSCIVLNDTCTYKQQMDFFNTVNGLLDIQAVTIYYKLQVALQDLDCDIDIILYRNTQEVFETIVVDHNMTLKGLSMLERPIITGKGKNVLFYLTGDTILFEHITFDLQNAPLGLLVCNGCVVMKNCIIKGNQRMPTQEGIVVMSGGKLEMNDCHISDCSVAIVGKPNGCIILNECTVSNNNIGLKISDETLVDLKAISICHNELIGVCFDVKESANFEQNNDEPLECVQNTMAQECQLNGNGRDFLINKRSKIVPVEDIFTELSPCDVDGVNN